MKHKKLEKAMVFILLFSIASLFSDLTHEGASSIRGSFMSLLGASAGTIGFISGLGELVGYSMRYVFGKIVDKTKHYWPMVLIGYVFDIVAVPLLALVGENGWIFASGLFIVQRMGKAIKKPAKDTIMSFAASQQGLGKSFAIQEFLDQIGAFLGPVFLYFIMLNNQDVNTLTSYQKCFAFLAIPGALTILVLLITKTKFPNPQNFEPEPKVYEKLKMKKEFILYIIGISLFAFGFIDYSIILVHVVKTYANQSFINTGNIPLLYAYAMLIDGFAALAFGILYDKSGLKALVWSTILSSGFAIFLFLLNGPVSLMVGLTLWAIGMGAQESILKAAVATMVGKSARATGYGVFECSFGVFWFLGSWTTGMLYDLNIPLMVGISVLTQALAVVFYISSSKCK